MRKTKFKYQLRNEDLLNEFSGECFYYDDKKIVVFNEENGTQVFVDFKHFILTRENDEMILVLDFNGGDSYVEMKQMNRKVMLSLFVKDKELEKNKFMVNYTLSGYNIFEFVFEWDLEGE